jgi:ferredoxin
MKYVIDTDLCINCGACEPDCPNSAISEGANGYTIDQSKCDGCGTCRSNCPVEAPHEG